MAHPAERVWHALTDPGELRKWFPSDEYVIADLTEPHRLLAGTWYGEPMRFELVSADATSVLTMAHAVSDLSAAARTAAGWECGFDALEALLGGTPLNDFTSLRRWPEFHETYSALWGLDPEPGRQSFAAHPLTEDYR